ncbi:MAG: hypothetical protein ACFFDW_15555 [Candidatus Thorarchaeota archaeon]
MAVIESGLIINGIPLIRSEYYLIEKNVDPFIKTSLFTAIQTFASNVFGEEAEEMRFKKYIIVIKKLNPDMIQQYLLYMIIERGTDVQEVKKRLNNLMKKINLEELPIDNPLITNEIKELKKIIDKEIRDLVLKPADRAKFIFG